MAEKPRPRIGASKKGRRALIDVAILHLGKMRGVADVDTQLISRKLLKQLEKLFDLAISIAKGDVRSLVDSRGQGSFQH